MCVCRASTWFSTESPQATPPWPRLSGTRQPSPPRWSSTGRFRRWCPCVQCTEYIIKIFIYIRLAWFSPSARTSINPFSPDWRQKAFQLLKNLHSCHRQTTLKGNKDIFWGFRVILDRHWVSLNCDWVQELRRGQCEEVSKSNWTIMSPTLSLPCI